MNQYEKLGQILSETLENGEIPEKFKNYKTEFLKSAQNEERLQTEKNKNSTFNEEILKNIYKISQELKLLNLELKNLNKKSLKENYHRELKKVHPDTNIFFVKKSAESAKKIKELKSAYKKILDFLTFFNIS